MDDDIAIEVKNVSKDFILPHKKRDSVKSFFLSPFSKFENEKQHALENISFDIKKGEFFGIVGRNGSGKSTLLKCIAGVYAPNTGHIKVNGSLVPFIELGVGFNPELSGRDNVFLNGALLGFNREQMQGMYDEIVDFAEIEKFMDQKLKNYSSGMQVRLAFSIAIKAQGDILLLDEVLAVGDSAFQQKCFNYFEKLKHDKKTVILVTHAMDSVKRFCGNALLIDNGNIKAVGSAAEIADQYLLDNISESNKKGTTQNTQPKRLKGKIKSLEAKLISKAKLTRNDKLAIEVQYSLSESFEPVLGVTIDKQGVSAAEINSIGDDLGSSKDKKHKAVCNIDLNSFNPGQYKIDVAIFDKKNMEVLGYMLGFTQFIIEGDEKTRGGAMWAKGGWQNPDSEKREKGLEG